MSLINKTQQFFVELNYVKKPTKDEILVISVPGADLPTIRAFRKRLEEAMKKDGNKLVLINCPVSVKAAKKRKVKIQ